MCAECNKLDAKAHQEAAKFVELLKEDGMAAIENNLQGGAESVGLPPLTENEVDLLMGVLIQFGPILMRDLPTMAGHLIQSMAITKGLKKARKPININLDELLVD